MKKIAYLFLSIATLLMSCSKENPEENIGNGVVKATINMKLVENATAIPDPTAMTFLIPDLGKKINWDQSNLKIGEIWFEGEKNVTRFSKPGFANVEGLAEMQNVQNGKYILVVRSIKMYSTTYTSLEIKDDSVVLEKTFKKYDSQNEPWEK